MERERELRFARSHIAALEQLLEVHEHTSIEQSARLEESRAELLRVFDQAPAAIATTVGANHVFRSANAKYQALVGQRELIGLPARTAFPELAAPGGLLDLLDKVFASGEPIVGNEVLVPLDRSGTGEPELLYFDFVYQPLFESGTSVWGIMVHAVEVTEQVAARHRLEETARELRTLTDALERSNALAQESRAAAEDANKAKSNFLATMSHELRTPLNAIGGYAQLVETGVYGPVLPQQEKALQRITRAQSHLLALINDILNFAKVEAGKIDFAIRPVSLEEATSGLGALIEPQARAKRISYSVAKGADINVNVDRERFQQILLNLLTNAVKFTPEGGHIIVSWKLDGATAKISVIDTGIGIPREKIDTIFEPFMQVSRYRMDAAGGVGLGLAISRELARAMGGDLSVSSRKGKGSVFTLSLPKL